MYTLTSLCGIVSQHAIIMEPTSLSPRYLLNKSIEAIFLVSFTQIEVYSSPGIIGYDIVDGRDRVPWCCPQNYVGMNMSICLMNDLFKWQCI